MNRLEKRASVNLVGVILCALIAGPGIWWMVRANTHGPAVLAAFLAAGIGGGFIKYLRSRKWWHELDEREQKIALSASNLSRCVFILFLYCATFIVFFIVGASNHVPSYLLPALFITAVLLAAVVESAVLLVRFAKDRQDEQR